MTMEVIKGRCTRCERRCDDLIEVGGDGDREYICQDCFEQAEYEADKLAALAEDAEEARREQLKERKNENL